MKNILFMLALYLIGISCTPLENTIDHSKQGGFVLSSVDFSKYTDLGFQFTPEKPSGDYKSIGMVDLKFIPQIRTINIQTFNKIKTSEGDGEYVSGSDLGIAFDEDKKYRAVRYRTSDGTDYYAVEVYESDKVIESLYKIASDMGANAVVNLEIRNTFSEISFTTTVSGFAIKRN